MPPLLFVHVTWRHWDGLYLWSKLLEASTGKYMYCTLITFSHLTQNLLITHPNSVIYLVCWAHSNFTPHAASINTHRLSYVTRYIFYSSSWPVGVLLQPLCWSDIDLGKGLCDCYNILDVPPSPLHSLWSLNNTSDPHCLCTSYILLAELILRQHKPSSKTCFYFLSELVGILQWDEALLFPGPFMWTVMWHEVADSTIHSVEHIDINRMLRPYFTGFLTETGAQEATEGKNTMNPINATTVIPKIHVTVDLNGTMCYCEGFSL